MGRLLLVALIACSACQAGKSSPGPSRIRVPDGVEIAYEEHGPRSDVTLFFLHGWGMDRDLWREEIRLLAEDYRCVAIDFPGHGLSSAEREDWSAAGLGEDVAIVMDALELEDVILVGHSMSGPIALAAAHLAPNRVRAIVGVDTLHDAELVLPQEMRAQILTGFEADYEGTLRQSVPNMFRPDADPVVVEFVILRALQADRAALLALLPSLWDVELAAWLEAAKVPVRCVNAMPNPGWNPETRVDTNRKHADFDAVILEDVGHYPMLERPDAFHAALVGAIEELAASED